jgi:hypothetical protein
VDTGVEAIIISEEVSASAGLGKGTCKAQLLNAKHGAEMSATGGVTATLQLADQKLDWPVYVVPIRDKVLFGMDILKGLDVTVFARHGDLIVSGKLLPGYRSQEKTNPYYRSAIHLSEETTLTPEILIAPTWDVSCAGSRFFT